MTLGLFLIFILILEHSQPWFLIKNFLLKKKLVYLGPYFYLNFGALSASVSYKTLSYKKLVYVGPYFYLNFGALSASVSYKPLSFKKMSVPGDHKLC